MLLKPYQQAVLADLARYVALLDGGRQSPAAAFATFWKTHPQWPLDLAEAQKNHLVRPYQSLPALARTPQVTIKVPTGGGKTYVACHAVGTLLGAVPTGTPRLVVWLVPSLVILDQTLLALRNRRHPYRQALEASFGGRVEVINKDELAQGRGLLAAARGEQLTVAVLSLNTLRTTDPDNRKAYDANSANLAFTAAFAGQLPPPVARPDGTPTDATATMNVLRAIGPVVIADESHHAKTTLSEKMLLALAPRFVLELTATPRSSSNLLALVSAQALKLEHMVKLPVVVQNHHRKEEVLAAAKLWQERLERLAREANRKQGAYPVRPIVLLQAEARTGPDSEDFDKIKAALRKLGVPEEHIKIKVSGRDELAGMNLLAAGCPVRFIITVNALAEGWDCSFAYILASVANRSSPVQVEQLLGRVLRQPYATPHPERLLNCSYVLTASAEFQATLKNIVAGLELAGYTAADYRSLNETDPADVAAAVPTEAGGQGLLAFGSAPVPAGDYDFVGMEALAGSGNSIPPAFFSGKEGEAFSEAEQHQNYSSTSNYSPFSAGEKGREGEVAGSGGEVLAASLVALEAQATAAALAAEAVAVAATQDPSTDPSPVAHQAHTYAMSPPMAALAQSLKLPEFIVPGPGGLFPAQMPLSKEYLLAGFRLDLQGTNLRFDQMPEALRVVDIAEQADHSYTPIVGKADAQLREPLLAYFRASSPTRQREDVVSSLTNLLSRALKPLSEADLRAYLHRVFTPFDPEQLRDAFYQPNRYADVVREAIDGFTNAYAVEAFDRQLDTGTIKVAPGYTLPARRVAAAPALPLPRSLYEREEDGTGVERAMMQLLADAENVTFWTRNPAKPSAGFRLNGPLANHYPDFIVCTAKGNLLLIETKGDHLDNPESDYKRRLGRDWVTAAGRDYRYYMVFEQKTVAGAQRLATFGSLLAGL